MKKRFIAMVLMCMMVLSLMSTSVLAVDVGGNSPAAVSEKEADPRISETTKSLSLKTTGWTELYRDSNWFDAVATISNNEDNPGSIYIRITAKTSGGKTDRIVDTSLTNEPTKVGQSFVSPKIASSYDSYTVYVKATENAGTYSITYHD